MIWESLYLMLYIMNKQSLILSLQSTLIIGLDIVSILTLLRAIALSLGPSISFLIIIKHVHPWCSGLFFPVPHHASFTLTKVDPFVFNICPPLLCSFAWLARTSLQIFSPPTCWNPIHLSNQYKYYSLWEVSLSNDPSQKLSLNIL